METKRYKSYKNLREDTIRVAVLDHLNRTGFTRYHVARSVRGLISASLVYRWLAGKGNIGTDAASTILAALGLSVQASPDRPGDAGAAATPPPSDAIEIGESSR